MTDASTSCQCCSVLQFVAMCVAVCGILFIAVCCRMRR